MATMTPTMLSTIIGAGATVKSMQVQQNASKASQQQYAAQTKRLNAQQAADERKRVDLLKRKQATQRARFAGLGIGSGGGSADAVLEGLTKTSAQQAADQSERTNFKRTELEKKSRTDLLSYKSKNIQDNISLLIGKK